MPSKRPTEQTRKTVKALAGFNASLDLIGDVLGIKPESVQKLYAKELQIGPEHIRVDLRRTLYDLSKEQDSAGRATAVVKLLENLEAQDAVAKLAENPLERVYLQPDAKPVYGGVLYPLRARPNPGELFLADDSPAPPLFYREKCAKSILDLHPAEVRDAQREGRNLEELFDRRGYRLKPLRIVSNENDLKGEWRLFDQHGRPFIFYRSERGDDKV